jgi:hypothetical protein
MNMDKAQLQKEWNRAMIFNFIRRMLLYYDPMNLCIMGAPDDEHDSYIPKIFHLLEETIQVEALTEGIYKLFESENDWDKADWHRRARRMAEDLVDLFSQKKK